MKILQSIALFVGIVILVLALPLLLSQSGNQTTATAPTRGAPWQVEVLPDGATRVLGLIPGKSSLDDVRHQLGPDAQIALVIATGESGAVEIYYETISVGSVAGKMILPLVTTLAAREEMLKRAHKAEFMSGTTRRVTLDSEDLARLGKAVISSISFIPSANLDEQIIPQRFGPPSERIRSDEGAEHFLYPSQGIDIQLNTKGKELLQYVAPGEFARLRAPLINVSSPGPN